jgi:hypothetical protein
MKKNLLILLSLIVFANCIKAQDFAYGNVTESELQMKKYAKDTSAHAVVLSEYGKSVINITGDDHIRLIYEYHVKIKIFDSKGFSNATVEIPVYNNKDNDSYEEVSDITGFTSYTDESGRTQKTELDTKNIYPVKENKHWANYKFTMPGLKNGCIIEYKYRLISPYFENFHSWNFQWDIPKVYSEYEVHIPANYVYNASLRGILKLTKNTSSIERNCFTVGGSQTPYGGSGGSDCSLIIYGMGDIPAFIVEDNMTSPKNFMSAINFELSEFTNPYSGVKTKMTKEWKDIDYQLKTYSDFGGQLKRKGLLKDKIAPVIAGKTDELQKAKAIYAYLQKWFKWNDFTGIFSVDGIGKALDSHSGSIADINLSLVTALNAAGINTEAVLLSTREHGMVNSLYPVITDFNYVVAKVNIGDKNYLLDASDPLLAFGMLPLKCLNDQGRVMSLDKPSYWINLNGIQKRAKTYTFDLTLQENGKLKGTLINYSVGYEAYEKRRAIKKFNTLDEYVENLGERLPRFKILTSEVTNLDSLNLPMSEKYEVEIDAYNSLHDKLLFNPFILDWLTVNPYKLAERNFPVDLGMPSDSRVILIMHLPANYVVENQPQNIGYILPNQGGRFLTNFEPDQNTFTFSHITQFTRPVYSPEEYRYLKELYNKIIQSEKAEMVFRKK